MWLSYEIGLEFLRIDFGLRFCVNGSLSLFDSNADSRWLPLCNHDFGMTHSKNESVAGEISLSFEPWFWYLKCLQSSNRHCNRHWWTSRIHLRKKSSQNSPEKQSSGIKRAASTMDFSYFRHWRVLSPLRGFKEIALTDESGRRSCIECVRLVSKFQNHGAPVQIRLLQSQPPESISWCTLCSNLHQVSKRLQIFSAVKAIQKSSWHTSAPNCQLKSNGSEENTHTVISSNKSVIYFDNQIYPRRFWQDFGHKLPKTIWNMSIQRIILALEGLLVLYGQFQERLCSAMRVD